MMTMEVVVGADSVCSVQGKTALVTGGSRGIGFMIAEGFLRAGARVFISSRNAEAFVHPSDNSPSWVRYGPSRRTSTTLSSGGRLWTRWAGPQAICTCW